MINSFFKFYKYLFSFKGTTTRKDYSVAVLIHYLLIFLSLIICFAFGAFTYGAEIDLVDTVVISLIGLWNLFVFIGLITIYFRRMRNAGQKILLSIILFILNGIPYIQILTGLYSAYLLFLKPSLRES